MATRTRKKNTDSRATSLWLSAETLSILQARAIDDTGSRSIALRKIVARYEQMIQSALPSLTAEEWEMVIELLKAVPTAERLEDLQAAPSLKLTTKAQFANWCRRWNTTEKVAILDLCERLIQSRANAEGRTIVLLQLGAIRPAAAAASR